MYIKCDIFIEKLQKSFAPRPMGVGNGGRGGVPSPGFSNMVQIK